ncbi:MAG: hypothetical protein H6631_15895 [Anaerolineaceae bacterium]|nr:hypothetical protein [Anaerolineaceae bacterium]
MESLTQLFTTIFETHPWHVPLVHFPIALSGAALLFLLLALWQRNELLERAAFYNISLAAVSTVLAGVTGYRDYIVRYEGDAPYANTKIFLAISLFVLATVIAVSRWRQPDLLWKPSTMILYLLGFAGCFMLATALGFLGGVILYGF